MKPTDKKSLFGKPGYIKASEYLENCLEGREGKHWQLPLGVLERLQFLMLRVFFKFSWFSNVLYVLHPTQESPYYAALLKFFKSRRLFDVCVERSMAYPGAYSYYLHKDVLVNNKPSYINAQGIADTPEVALSKALGEMFERIISGIWDQNKQTTTASVTELRKNNIVHFYPPDHHDFLLTQKEKFPELDHQPGDAVVWVTGKNLVTGEPVRIPRQVTSWFEGTRNSKKIFLNSTTNGSAAYFTRNGAVLRGLLEVVQRDGFFVHWLTKTAPKVIALDSLPADLKAKVEVFQSLGITLTILDITSLAVPNVCIVAETKSAKVPAVVVSAAADTSYHGAIFDALREMIGGAESFYRTHLTPLEEESAVDVYALTKISRQSYWRGQKALKKIQWFISGASIRFQDLEKTMSDIPDSEKLEQVIQTLAEAGAGYQPIVYEPTHPLTKEVGMFVTQVFVPQAFPLYLLEKYGSFASKRIGEFWRKTNKDKEFVLNTEPHMFS